MLEVTVRRSEWLRGKDSVSHDATETQPAYGGSFLYREDDGKKCCLGFACLAAGLSIQQIKGVPTPGSVARKLQDKFPKELSGLVEYNDGTRHLYSLIDSGICTALMSDNDRMWHSAFGDADSEYTDAEREAYLTKMGLEVGIKFTFID